MNSWASIYVLDMRAQQLEFHRSRITAPLNGYHRSCFTGGGGQNPKLLAAGFIRMAFAQRPVPNEVVALVASWAADEDIFHWVERDVECWANDAYMSVPKRHYAV